MPTATTTRIRPKLGELWRDSLYLGLVGFGGGMSVLASIRALVVEKRRWLTEREFGNAVTVSQMLPGGAAANALAYLGLRFAGLQGAVTAYAGFVLPGFVCVMGLAWAYTHFGTTPDVETVLGGFNAAVVGVITAITLKMLRTSVGRLWQMGVAAGALLFSLASNASPGEIAILSAFIGVAGDLGTKRLRLRHVRRAGKRPGEKVALPEEGTPLKPLEPLERRAGFDRSLTGEAVWAPEDGDDDEPKPPDPPRAGTVNLPAWVSLLGLSLVAGLGTELFRMALTFFRTGLGAYGGGFAIVPHLQQVMRNTGWLTDRQFADAVAIGKLTPGPVLLLATFIGYVRHGALGGLVATLAIFAAPFALVVVAGTWLDRMRSRRTVRAALRGLTPAVLGLMAAAALSLGGTLAGDEEIAIAAAVALTLLRFDVNPALMLAVGGVARVALRALHL